MKDVWLWIVVALLAAIAEVVGSGLVFIGIAAAALVAAIVSIFVPGLLLEAIVFTGAAIVYLIGLRPPVLRLISGQSHVLSANASSHQILGKRGTVVREVSLDGGQIRIGHGEFWSARPYNSHEVLPVGSSVEVLGVDGLMALVTAAPAAISSEATDHSA